MSLIHSWVHHLMAYIVSCKCCGNGVLEIKCPYLCRDTSFRGKATESTFFLDKIDGELTQNMNHAYYFQVQAQLKLCNAKYCDFVVFHMEELFIQRIYLNEPFITIALEKCKEFSKVGMLPELLGKFYSIYCTCVIHLGHL